MLLILVDPTIHGCCFHLPLLTLYCQVKIFCDKGAERKLRDEERRAAKRRMTPSGKRRLDEMYHETFDREEMNQETFKNNPQEEFRSKKKMLKFWQKM